VTDTARGLAAIGAGADAVGTVTNLGSGSEVTIGELIARCCALAGYQPRIETDPERARPERGEVMRLLCDPSRAARTVDWRPRVSLDAGLEQTFAPLARQPPDDDG